MLKRCLLWIALATTFASPFTHAGLFEKQSEGQVNFIVWANRPYDVHTSDPSAQKQAWMRDHYWRMITHTPYFDNRLSWYPNAWFYFDIAAVYTDRTRGDADIIDHQPDWILKDAAGNKLFIPWGCSGGSCPQYAGNMGNPAFRAFRIAQMKAAYNKGYKGLWLDDVNMSIRTSYASGQDAVAIDTNTGQAMTLTNWRKYVAQYTEEVRRAFPEAEIVHNALWFSDENRNDPYIARQLKAADYFNAERGASDAGLRGGDGFWSYRNFLRYLDYVHSLGRGVLMMDYGTSLTQREFGLASWFLISEGVDMLNSNQMEWADPDRFWFAYNLDLGRALGARYETANQLIRRDFQCGTVILNPPEAPVRTVQLNGTFTNLNNQAVTQVQLAARSAAVLRKTCGNSPATGLKGVVAATGINHHWKSQELPGLMSPVVIAAAPSHRGIDSGVVRLRNVSGNGFQLRFQEWDYRDGVHVQEQTSYAAFETGRYPQPDGSVWLVGRFNQSGTGQWRRQNFATPLPGTPKLFLSAQTQNGGQAITVRARNVSASGFGSALYEEEGLMDGHVPEVIGFVAFYSPNSSGDVQIGDQNMAYQFDQANIGHNWAPILGGGRVRLQEEQSADAETAHVQENVDVLKLGSHWFVQDVSSKGGDPAAPRRQY